MLTKEKLIDRIIHKLMGYMICKLLDYKLI